VLTESNQNSFSVFLWHHPSDKVFANQLAEDLHSRRIDSSSMGAAIEETEESFHTADWLLAKSDCVVFLISEDSVKAPNLQTDVEKVMRRKETLLIPAYLDELDTGDLPLILYFIHPLEFSKDYHRAFKILVEEIDRKIHGKSSLLRKANNPWTRPFRWIIEHFRRYLILSPLTFCWQITVENLIVSLAVTGLIYLLWEPSPRTNLEDITASTYLWMIIILGPIVETIFLQALPIFFARILGMKFYGQLLFSILPFAVLHFTRSISAGIGAGIIGGFYSAFTYIHWQSKSTWTAFWVTAFSHCLYNLALFAMLIGEF
jgi:hypothetical protein